ncbi:MAG: hypothetical protein K0U29_02500 [Gammaproteobacteria bacterium]|nr:hypothetical protein [Gammaproteobacteria bacterium]MCH9743780.1 hypothetical protein [Gammaproteobacteria bacterium]
MAVSAALLYRTYWCDKEAEIQIKTRELEGKMIQQDIYSQETFKEIFRTEYVEYLEWKYNRIEASVVAINFQKGFRRICLNRHKILFVLRQN